MEERTAARLKQIFRQYYFENVDRVDVPTRIGEREFGHVPFEGGMIRHISFKSSGELHAALLKEAPAHVYYSCAYYADSTLPMYEKGWKGADLIFDIDADELDSPCKKQHDEWSCKECGHRSRGLKPALCPVCQGSRFEVLNWVCDECLGRAKDEALKLYDMLTEDLGFSKDALKTYFSGNMGYHIVVQDSKIEVLDQIGRAEVSDYVRGLGLDLRSLGVFKGATFEDAISDLPLHTESGWRGRIMRHIGKKMFTDQPQASDLRLKMAELYVTSKYRGFKKLVDSAVQDLGSHIDTSVTTDIHRIFRLGGTLHGETGLAKARVDRLEEFDPLTKGVVLGDETVEVQIHHSPQFRLKDETYGPFDDAKVKLPLMAAVYVMGRGLAVVV